MNGIPGRSSNRLVGMDFWRGALLSYGLFVHAAALADIPFFNAVEISSNLFRMEGFFAISGFFASVTLKKRIAPSVWLKKRLTSLVIPMLFGLTLVVPFSHWVAKVFSNGPHPILPFEPFADDWHIHIWFLLSLCCYVPFAVLLQRCYEAGKSIWPDWLNRPYILFAVVAIWGVVVTMGLELACRQLPMSHATRFLIRQTGYYFIFYGIGFFAHQQRELLASMERVPRLIMIAALMMALSVIAVQWTAVPDSYKFLMVLVARPVVGLTATCWILTHALKMKTESNIPFLIANSAYTIYILHLPLIILVYSGVMWMAGSYVFSFLASSVVTFFVLFFFHMFGVERSPFLKFILNGRISVKSV